MKRILKPAGPAQRVFLLPLLGAANCSPKALRSWSPRSQGLSAHAPLKDRFIRDFGETDAVAQCGRTVCTDIG
jgi:hypothetical protein